MNESKHHLPPSSGDDPEQEGFLSRWSRRKTQVRSGEIPKAIEPNPSSNAPGDAGAKAETKPQPQERAATQPSARADVAPHVAARVERNEHERSSATPDEMRLPTLDDVKRLTKDSDYSGFATPRVDPQVRNAAMKKLFHGDPHFNVMDGLDVYIDDYNTPKPISKSMLASMVQSRLLGLISDEITKTPAAGESSGLLPAPAPEALKDEASAMLAAPDDATSIPHDPPPLPLTADEDPALQLQPLDALRRDGTRVDGDEGLDPRAVVDPSKPSSI